MLRYIGKTPSNDQDVVRQRDTDLRISEVPGPESIPGEVSRALENIATSSELSTTSAPYATPDQVDSAFANKLDSLDGLARLNGSYLNTQHFNPVTARGARHFHITASTARVRSLKGDGPLELARLTVSNPNANRYMILAFAQIETKPDGQQATPAGSITVGSVSGTQVAWGMAEPAYSENWTMIDIMPSNYGLWSGQQTLFLNAVRGGAGATPIEYSGYATIFTVFTIPVFGVP